MQRVKNLLMRCVIMFKVHLGTPILEVCCRVRETAEGCVFIFCTWCAMKKYKKYLFQLF